MSGPGQDSPFQLIAPAGRLAQMMAYWQGLRPGGLPRRRDIDLMEMNPALLPHVFLVDVLEGGHRFRWRLIGTHIIRHAGTDDTGLDLEISIAPQMRPTIIGQYQEVVRERRPLCHRTNFVGRDGHNYRYERLMLPVLADDGGAVDTVLGGAVFAAEPRVMAPPPERLYRPTDDLPFEEIEPTGRLAAFLDHWRRLDPAGGVPRRTQLDLMRLDPALLPHVILVDVIENGQRFRWRLMGSELVRRSGTDDTGLDLEISVMPKMRAEVLAQNRQVVRERRPLCHRGAFVGRDLVIHRYERILMPLLDAEGKAVDTIFGGAVFAS